MTSNSNYKSSGPTLAWLVGYLSYSKKWGFNPSEDYTTGEYWDYVQGYETALREEEK